MTPSDAEVRLVIHGDLPRDTEEAHARSVEEDLGRITRAYMREVQQRAEHRDTEKARGGEPA